MDGILERFAYHPEATLGKLTINKEVFYIAERPWRNNKKNVSCVPVGEYICKKYKSRKFGETYQLTDVPGRTYILFHVGNFPEKDSEGCLLVGEEIMKSKPAIASSKKAMKRFMQTINGAESFGLKIKDQFPFDWSK